MKLVDTKKGILYIGSKDDAVGLIDKGDSPRFDIIWNLAEELCFLLEGQLKCASLILLGNIKDCEVPGSKKAFMNQLNQVVSSLDAGGSVFIHCLEGHGRTGLALAAIKMTLDGMSADNALGFAELHCQGPETNLQKQFVRSIKEAQ